jgi:PAS domain S-box-containing protein
MMNLVDTLEGINDCIVISTEKGVIISLNKAAREVFGYSRAETIGKVQFGWIYFNKFC